MKSEWVERKFRRTAMPRTSWFPFSIQQRTANIWTVPVHVSGRLCDLCFYHLQMFESFTYSQESAVSPTMSEETPIRACILVFDGMDMVDFVSPLETLNHAYKKGTTTFETLITTEVAAPTEEVMTKQRVAIKRQISWEQAAASLADYDILIAPGSFFVETMAVCDDPESPLIKMLQDFSKLPTSTSKTGQRILLSICSGSFFLAAAGLLDGRRVTTHYTMISQLETLAAKFGKTEVSRHIFVDAGLLDSGVRIISSGGLTSGFDASLYTVELMCGEECAAFASEVLEHPCRKSQAIF